MKDEIKIDKEFLTITFGNESYYDVPKRILDCITNLQQENDNLKKQLKGTTHCYDEEEHKRLQQENERLLELCMYALIYPTKIYNHYLANDTKKAFIDIIKNNLYDDTDSLRKEKEDYKSRCEKAIAKIKLLGKFDGKYCTRNFKMMSADFNDLLNILQGSDKE